MPIACKVADDDARNQSKMTRGELGNVDKSGKGSCQGSNMLSNDNTEGAMNDLRDCLPSWASQDQILGLLRDSDGDIVKAASYFFEHEVTFYEQANACTTLSTSGSPFILHNDVDSFPEPKPAQESLDTYTEDFLFQDKKPTRNIAAPKSSFPKRRISSTGSKPKKKGKPSTTLESTGPKQSTITNFFGKLVSNTSDEDVCGTKILVACPDEIYKEEVDQLLRIINGGITRDSAASLMEKAKGNMDVAVDMYYKSYNSISISEGSVISCSVQADTLGGLVGSCVKKEASTEDTTVDKVSLPIEMYSPIEHDA